MTDIKTWMAEKDQQIDDLINDSKEKDARIEQLERILDHLLSTLHINDDTQEQASTDTNDE